MTRPAHHVFANRNPSQPLSPEVTITALRRRIEFERREWQTPRGVDGYRFLIMTIVVAAAAAIGCSRNSDLSQQTQAKSRGNPASDATATANAEDATESKEGEQGSSTSEVFRIPAELFEVEVVAKSEKAAATSLSTAKVCQIAGALFGTDPSKVEPSTSLADLGGDELDVVDLVLELEDHFDVTISDNRITAVIGDDDWQAGLSKLTMLKLGELVDQLLGRGDLDVATAPTGDAKIVPDGMVFRPEFRTKHGDVLAGTAFAVSLPGNDRTILLSALHLLGPAGGLESDIPASEVAGAVSHVRLEPCFGFARTIDFPARAIPIDNAAPLGEESEAGDIMAFWIPGDAKVHPADFSTEELQRGRRVWLATAVGGADPAKRLHAATVTYLRDGLLYYTYDDNEISLRATSGAPILDANGDVIAINLGGGAQDSQLTGVGNPVVNFKPHLEKAIGPMREAR